MVSLFMQPSSICPFSGKGIITEVKPLDSSSNFLNIRDAILNCNVQSDNYLLAWNIETNANLIAHKTIWLRNAEVNGDIIAEEITARYLIAKKIVVNDKVILKNSKIETIIVNTNNVSVHLTDCQVKNITFSCPDGKILLENSTVEAIENGTVSII